MNKKEKLYLGTLLQYTIVLIKPLNCGNNFYIFPLQERLL